MRLDEMGRISNIGSWLVALCEQVIGNVDSAFARALPVLERLHLP